MRRARNSRRFRDKFAYLFTALHNKLKACETKNKVSWMEDPGQTDRVSMNATDCSDMITITLTLTYDLDFQWPASYGHDQSHKLSTCKT